MGAVYQRPVERPQLWLAGGTGLAPFLSMLAQVAEQGSDHPIVLYYAVTRAADLVELEEIGKIIKAASHCGLGQTAANPILTTLERLPNLYQMQLMKVGFEPGFDLDGALKTARKLTHRDDAAAHLAQHEENGGAES